MNINSLTNVHPSSFNFQWWQVDKVSPIKLFDENKTFIGFNLRHLLYQQGGADHCRKVINTIFDMHKEGKVKPVIDSVWALEDVRGI